MTDKNTIREKCGATILTPHYDNGHNGSLWCAEEKPCKMHPQTQNAKEVAVSGCEHKEDIHRNCYTCLVRIAEYTGDIEILIDNVVHELEAFYFNSKEAREVVRKVLLATQQQALEAEREQIKEKLKHIAMYHDGGRPSYEVNDVWDMLEK